MHTEISYVSEIYAYQFCVHPRVICAHFYYMLYLFIIFKTSQNLNSKNLKKKSYLNERKFKKKKKRLHFESVLKCLSGQSYETNLNILKLQRNDMQESVKIPQNDIHYFCTNFPLLH